ncbi:MAG TPA: PEP-CTERM sorting domain-containing protein [Opitutaceae bacterium]
MFAASAALALTQSDAPALTTLSWTSGSILTVVNPATVGSGDVLDILSTNDHDFNGVTLANNGTVNWQAGTLRTGSGGSVTNNATWNDSAGSTFSNPFGGGASFTNASGATYTRSGTGQTTFSTTFTNAGAMVLSAGGFEFQGGGSFASTGTMSAASGTTVYFNSAFSLATGAALSGAGLYQLYGNTLTVSGSVSVSNFELAGGTLAGTHTLTGATTWKGSSLSSSGTTTIPSGSTLAISNTVDHDFNSRSLVNNGTVNWQAGTLRTGSDGAVTNNATWNDSAGSTFSNPFGGGASFTNSSTGTYNRSGSGQTTFSTTFTNSGSIVLSAGALEFQGGGSFTSTGTMSAATGTTVYFNSAFSLSAGAALSGAGTYQLYGNTLTVSGGVSLSNFELAGGTLAGTHTLTGATTWKGSSLSSSGTTTIPSGSTFTISTSADHDFNSRSLVNNGTVNWQAGTLRTGSDGAVTNNATWSDTAGSTFSNPFGGGASFTNSSTGTYNRSGSGQTTFSTTFTNSGSIALTAGAFEFQGGGSFTSTGTMSAASGTTVYFNSAFSLSAGATLSGSGTYQLYGNTLTVSGGVSLSNFELAGGTLAGTHTLTGATTWKGSSLSSSGTTTIPSGSTFTISTSADHDFNSRSLINNGTVNWQAGALRTGSDGAVTNNATWNDSAGSTFSNPFGGGASFTNAAGATYTKSGSGTATFSSVAFTNAGTVEINGGTLAFSGGYTQTAGSLFLNNGNASASSFSLQGGTLKGSGTLTGNVSLGGNLAASPVTFNVGTSPGQLTITGNLSLLSTAVTQIELGGTTQGTGYDFIDVTGTATLGGTLTLAFVSGFGTSVTNADTFTILRAGSFTGAFTNISSGQYLTTTDGLAKFLVTQNATTLQLSQFTPVPEPSTWTLLITGGGLSAWWQWRKRRRG